MFYCTGVEMMVLYSVIYSVYIYILVYIYVLYMYIITFKRYIIIIYHSKIRAKNMSVS